MLIKFSWRSMLQLEIFSRSFQCQRQCPKAVSDIDLFSCTCWLTGVPVRGS